MQLAIYPRHATPHPKMYKLLLVAAVLAALLLSSCASMLSQSEYAVIFDTDPPGETITISDSTGAEIFTGPAPAIVPLRASSGYLDKAVYTVTSGDRTETLAASPDPWWFGNAIFGILGLFGAFVVDANSGASHMLPDRFTLSMEEQVEPPPEEPKPRKSWGRPKDIR